MRRPSRLLLWSCLLVACDSSPASSDASADAGGGSGEPGTSGPSGPGPGHSASTSGPSQPPGGAGGSSGDGPSDPSDPSGPGGPGDTTGGSGDSRGETSAGSGNPPASTTAAETSGDGDGSSSASPSGSSSTSGSGNDLCDPAPSTCFLPQDLGNHSACDAALLSLDDDGVDFAIAEIDDAVCGDGSEHWFVFAADAKRLYRIHPDGPAHVDVFVGDAGVEEAGDVGPSELTPLDNPFDPGAMHNRFYVPDGEAGSEVWVYVRLTTSAKVTGTHLTIDAYPDRFDCVDPYLTQHGAQHYRAGGDVELSAYVGGLRNWDAQADNRIEPAFPGDGSVNAMACRKTLADPDDPGSGWATMEIVRCVDGELEVVSDCMSDFPQWDAELEAEFGELMCNVNAHPGGQMWCEPAEDPDQGSCALRGAEDGQVSCVEDRWLFGCSSNAGHLFDDDPALYNPESITEDGYAVGVDCMDGELHGLSAEEAARSSCGYSPLRAAADCLHDREQSVLAEVPEPAAFRAGPSHLDFPRTQNIVSCGNPGEGNGVPYLELDTLSGVYTDHHVAAARPYLDDLHARGLGYLGYLNAWGPEQKTSWGPNPDSNAPWATMTYQYGYWDGAMAADLGEPETDYAAYERGCWDADGDGIDNMRDRCPTTFAGGQADADEDGIGDACDATPGAADEDPDGDGLSARDNDGNGRADDNCPNVANADQADTDHNGIGDACQSVATAADGDRAVSCDPGATSACVDMFGAAARKDAPMQWVMDLGQPRTQQLLIGWTKLAVLAGMDGMTFDVATMADCFGDATLEAFRTMLDNGGHLERNLRGSEDVNDAARLDAYWRLAEEHGGSRNALIHPDWSGFDIRVARAEAEPLGTWHDHPARRLWEIYKVDTVRAFMKTMRSEVAAYVDTVAPGRNFPLFFNQGPSNQFSTAEQDGEEVLLKDLAGAETFIRSGHPLSGANDCVGVEGDAYPANGTMEIRYALHQNDGLRFWSWNFPDNTPDDRPVLFAAETLAAGGLYQTPHCSADFHYPDGGYSRPHYSKRLAQAAVAPFVTHNWDKLGLPQKQGQVAMYWPQALDEACQSGPEFGEAGAEMLFRTLRASQYTVDVIGRGAFGNGKASIPTASDLEGYDFVALGHRFLSNAEVEQLTAFVLQGGHLVVLGDVGDLDEWCSPSETSRATWRSHFANFGTTAYGDGAFHQLSGGTSEADEIAYVTEDGASMAAAEAFAYLEGPNAGRRLCDDAELEVADVPWARLQLRSWLQERLAAEGLAPSRFGGGLQEDVHVFETAQGENTVVHLVNYALDAVPYEGFHDGENAGPTNFVDRTAYFGCSVATPLEGFGVPIPEHLRGTAGAATVTLLDYEAPNASFFPFADNPASPCASMPLGASYPAAGNDFAYPEIEVAFGVEDTEVVLDGIAMKQWAIVTF